MIYLIIFQKSNGMKSSESFNLNFLSTKLTQSHNPTAD
jgi:hypothetical protein